MNAFYLKINVLTLKSFFRPILIFKRFPLCATILYNVKPESVFKENTFPCNMGLRHVKGIKSLPQTGIFTTSWRKSLIFQT